MIPQKILEQAVKNGVNDESVKEAEKFGKDIAKGANPVSTSQLRRFYGEVKRLQVNGFDSHRNDFAMLKPKLAYAVGRAKKDAKRDRVTGMQEPLKIDNLYECLCSAMAFVSDEKTFDNFVQVFEAIVAYHKTVAKN